MHMPDSRTMLTQSLQRVSAAETVVTHVETEPDKSGIGQLDQPVDCSRRLDKAGTVMVKNGSESHRPPHLPGDAFHAGGKHLPLLLGQALLGLDPSCIFRPHRVLAVVVREN